MLLIERHPDPGDERLRRIIDKLTAVLNGLLRAGVIIQTGDSDFSIDITAISGATTIINGMIGGGRGAMGPRGLDANRWLTGKEPPRDRQGTQGDLYFQAHGGLVWEKRADTLGLPRWEIIAKLPAAGRQGPPGPQGPPGRPGSNGLPGEGIPTAAWTGYTPTWTGSVSDPAIGNGTIAGAYQLIGKQMAFRLDMVAGTTTTFGSGFWTLGLPPGVSAKTGARQTALAMGQVVGSSTAAGICFIASGGTNFQICKVDGTLFDSTVPHAWSAASTNILRVNGVVEVN